MKELSVEEKVNRYNEAYERARMLKETCDSNAVVGWMEYIFPELAESEDEKIIKAIVTYLKSVIDNKGYRDKIIESWISWLEKQGDSNKEYWRGYREGKKEILDKYSELEKQGEQKPIISDDALREGITHFGITQYQIDNWLKKYVDVEKQGEQKKELLQELDDKVNNALENETSESLGKFLNEQKPADKAEPKFKVGDWISGYYTNYKVLSVNNDGYLVEDVDGNKINILFENEKFHHLFTIADAKDGDVLIDEDNNIGIYKEIEGICWHSYIYLGCDNRLYGFSLGGSHIQNNTKPATKEQRDTLEKAMAKAGWKFDFEKKELKKVEQKPAWSEEDIELLNNAIKFIEDSVAATSPSLRTYSPTLTGKEIPFLKALKNRVQLQQEWSEEDEQYLLICKNALAKYQTTDKWDACIISSWLENKLKFLRPQINVTDEELAEAKKEAYNEALDKIEYHSGEPTFDDGWSAAIWYLKKRNGRPQNTWKPSDEQMDVLDDAIAICSERDYETECRLDNLRQNLKKLKD